MLVFFQMSDNGLQYTMEIDGELFDGSPIDSLAKRVNHGTDGDMNMEFVHTEGVPYAQLEDTEFVTAGEELFADYGPGFNYVGFTR